MNSVKMLYGVKDKDLYEFKKPLRKNAKEISKQWNVGINLTICPNDEVKKKLKTGSYDLVVTHGFEKKECEMSDELKKIAGNSKIIIESGTPLVQGDDREKEVLKHCDYYTDLLIIKSNFKDLLRKFGYIS